MKKFIIALIIACSFPLLIIGCNMGVGIGNFEFHGIHVCDHNGNCRDLAIDKWYDNESGIEVKTTDSGSLFCSEGTYILYEDKCPICSIKNG